MNFLFPYLNIAKTFYVRAKIRYSALFSASRILLIILAAVLANAVLAGQIENLTASLAEKRSLLKVWLERDNTVIQLRRDYEVVKEIVPKLSNPLPTIETFPVFINELENLAAATGNAQTLVFQEPQNSGVEDILAVPFAITLSNASYNSAREYIKKFEDLPYFADIEKIAFSASSGINISGQVTLEGKAYIRK